MAENLFFCVKAHLSKAGLVDHSKFRIGWDEKNQRQIICEWRYDTPQPDPSTLPAPTPAELFIEKENSVEHKADVFTGRVDIPTGTRANTAWWPITLTAVRNPCVSTPVSGSADRLSVSSGIFKLSLFGYTDAAAAVHIVMIVPRPGGSESEEGLCAVNVPAGQQFDFGKVVAVPDTISIRVKARRQDNGSALNLVATLLVEQL
jgi:hypothetical protein